MLGKDLLYIKYRAIEHIGQYNYYYHMRSQDDNFPPKQDSILKFSNKKISFVQSYFLKRQEWKRAGH